MRLHLPSIVLILAAFFFCITPLRAELDSFDKWRLDEAKREWQNERYQGMSIRVRQNDLQIQDALRRGERGDPYWKNDFDSLMQERQFRRAQERQEMLMREEMQRRQRRKPIPEPTGWTIHYTYGSSDSGDVERQFIEQLGWEDAQEAIKRYHSLPKPRRTLYRRYDRRGRIVEEAWE